MHQALDVILNVAPQSHHKERQKGIVLFDAR